jgi:UDP-glucuronate decarboxylase
MGLEGATKRVLVTGGAGFLGSHPCERIFEAGHDLLCVDNLYTGSRDNVLPLIGHRRSI